MHKPKRPNSKRKPYKAKQGPMEPHLSGRKHIVLAVGDMHHPFCHPDALAFLKAVEKKYKPTVVVCLGDEVDQHALGRYPKDPDGLSAGEELQVALDKLIPFYVAFPKVMVCESNHTTRAYKRGFEAGLPKAFLKDIEIVLNAPEGWQWASEWLVDDVLYIHGDPFFGKNACEKHATENWGSVVIGHTHSYAHVKTFHKRRGNFFAMDVGCLIDEESYAFAYARKMNHKPTLGCGIITYGIHAEFIPMVVDKKNRWISRLL